MGLGVSLITFSPNTTIKSADMNTNLANLNNAGSFSGSVAATSLSASGMFTATGGFSLSRLAGQTEPGSYYLNGWGGASGDNISAWVPSLSRNITPVSVNVDTSNQAPTGCNNPSTGTLLSGGFHVFTTTTSAITSAYVGGNYTINY